MAELTGGATGSVPSSWRLKQPFADIGRRVATRYLLRYQPRGVKRAGIHRVEVKVKGRGLDVRYRREYRILP